MAILHESTTGGAFLPFLPLRLNKLEIAGMAPKNKHTAGPRAEKDETNPRFLLVLLLDEVCYLSCASKSASENEFEDHVFTSCVYIYTYIIIIYSYSNFGYQHQQILNQHNSHLINLDLFCCFA